MFARTRAQEVKYINWYQNFKNASAAELDNIKLARMTNPKLDEIMAELVNEFKMIDDRRESGKTFCLIFDSKSYNRDTVTDALVTENITAKFEPTREYYIKGDKKAKVVTEVEKETTKSKVMVPTKMWTSLEGLRLTLSPNTYSDFLQKCQERKYYIDSIVITLNSPHDLKKDDIKMLLKKVHESYPDPFILLNDAHEIECTMWKDCDTCYEGSRDFLNQIQINEDRFMKVSAKSIIGNGQSKITKDDNFTKFKGLLEEEIKLENVIERLLSKTEIFMNNFEKMEKLIEEDRVNVQKTTENFEQNLKANKMETEAVFDNSKRKIEIELDQIQEKADMNSLNNNVVKNNIESTISNGFDRFRVAFKNKIREIIKGNNPKFENYIPNMFENEYLNPNDYEVKLKDDIEKCMEEIYTDLEIANVEESKKGSLFSKFLAQIKGLLTNTFESIKNAFDRFVEQFKDKILNKYQNFEKRIKKSKKEFMVNQINSKINAKETSIRKLISDNINIRQIKSKGGVNIYPNDNTEDFTQLETISSDVLIKIKNDIIQLKNDIANDIAPISSNRNNNKTVFNTNNNDQKLYANKPQTNMNTGWNVDSHKSRIGAGVGAVIGLVVGYLLFSGVWTLLGGIWGSLLGSDWVTYIWKTDRKDGDILLAIEKASQSLQKKTDSLFDEIKSDLDRFLRED